MQAKEQGTPALPLNLIIIRRNALWALQSVGRCHGTNLCQAMASQDEHAMKTQALHILSKAISIPSAPRLQRLHLTSSVNPEEIALIQTGITNFRLNDLNANVPQQRPFFFQTPFLLVRTTVHYSGIAVRHPSPAGKLYRRCKWSAMQEKIKATGWWMMVTRQIGTISVMDIATWTGKYDVLCQ